MTILERWFEEVWNKGNESAIDEMADPNVVAHGLLDADGKEVRNVAGFKVFYKQFRSAFPDIHIEIEETVSEGNKIAAAASSQPHIAATESAGHQPTSLYGSQACA